MGSLLQIIFSIILTPIFLVGAILGWIFNRQLPRFLRALVNASLIATGLAGSYIVIAVLLFFGGMRHPNYVMMYFALIMLAFAAIVADTFVWLCEKLAPMIMLVAGRALNPVGIHLTQINIGVRDTLRDLSIWFFMCSIIALNGPMIGLTLHAGTWVSIITLVMLILLTQSQTSIRRKIMGAVAAFFVVFRVLFELFPILKELMTKLASWIDIAIRKFMEWFLELLKSNVYVDIIFGLLATVLLIGAGLKVVHWIYNAIPRTVRIPATPTVPPVQSNPATPAPATPAPHGTAGGRKFPWIPAFCITVLALLGLILWSASHPTAQSSPTVSGSNAPIPFIQPPPPAPPAAAPSSTPAPAPVVTAPVEATAVDANWASKVQQNTADPLHNAEQEKTFMLARLAPNQISYQLDGRVKLVDQFAVDENGIRILAHPGDTIIIDGDPGSQICEHNDPCTGPQGQAHGRKPADYNPTEWTAYNLAEYPVRDAVIGKLSAIIGEFRMPVGAHASYVVPQGAGVVSIRLGANIRERFTPLAKAGHRVAVTIISSR